MLLFKEYLEDEFIEQNPKLVKSLEKYQEVDEKTYWKMFNIEFNAWFRRLTQDQLIELGQKYHDR